MTNKKRLKVYRLEYVPIGIYGKGVLLVVAHNKMEAEQLANNKKSYYRKAWENPQIVRKLIPNVKKSQIILQSHYEE